MSSKRLHIDVLADFICPWCYIGKRKLDQALSLPRDFEISLIWRPYQLDPTTPPEGIDQKTYLQKRFGADAGRGVSEKINQAAAGTGLEFDFGAIEVMPNTLRAHRLMILAGQYGKQHQLSENLFAAYFENGVDIGDVESLLALSDQCDMPRSEAEDALEKKDVDHHIDMSNMTAREAGLSGVPALILGGKHILMGAQDPDYLHRIFIKAYEKLPQPEASLHN